MDEEEDEDGEQKSQKPLECLSKSPRMSLGSFLSGLLLAAQRRFRASWVPRGPSGSLLRISRESLEGFLDASWAVWAAPGALLGALGALLGPSGKKSIRKEGSSN